MSRLLRAATALSALPLLLTACSDPAGKNGEDTFYSGDVTADVELEAVFQGDDATLASWNASAGFYPSDLDRSAGTEIAEPGECLVVSDDEASRLPAWMERGLYGGSTMQAYPGSGEAISLEWSYATMRYSGSRPAAEDEVVAFEGAGGFDLPGDEDGLSAIDGDETLEIGHELRLLEPATFNGSFDASGQVIRFSWAADYPEGQVLVRISGEGPGYTLCTGEVDGIAIDRAELERYDEGPIDVQVTASWEESNVAVDGTSVHSTVKLTRVMTAILENGAPEEAPADSSDEGGGQRPPR